MTSQDKVDVLVTGAAGFIGYSITRRLLESGRTVAGIDNFTPNYSLELKSRRLKFLQQYTGFVFFRENLLNGKALSEIFERYSPDRVLHLAARPGVRASARIPDPYLQANILASVKLLGCCRKYRVSHLIIASSSAVYGRSGGSSAGNVSTTDAPLSVYGATKRAVETLARTYADNFSIPVTILRLFTVYGPWGRPDMAYYRFARLIKSGEKLPVYGSGDLKRDFTYIDEVVEALQEVIDQGFYSKNQDTGGRRPQRFVPCNVYDVGCGNPVTVNRLVSELERLSGEVASVEYRPVPSGEMRCTRADPGELVRDYRVDFQVNLAQGLALFWDWFEKEGSRIP